MINQKIILEVLIPFILLFLLFILIALFKRDNKKIYSFKRLKIFNNKKSKVIKKESTFK